MKQTDFQTQTNMRNPWHNPKSYEPEILLADASKKPFDWAEKPGIFQSTADVSRWWPAAIILVVSALVAALCLR